MAEKVTIGNCELWHGDCMDYMRDLPDKAFDLAIVDPEFSNDKPIAPRYFVELFRIAKNAIIWRGNRYALPPSKHCVIWDKTRAEGLKFVMVDYAWTSFDDVNKYFKQSVDNEKDKIHPTQKPVKLYEWLLTNYAKQGQRILDTHLGGGSSAIAANELGFEFVGIELDADYYAAACKRIEQAYAQPRLFNDAKPATAMQSEMLSMEAA